MIENLPEDYLWHTEMIEGQQALVLTPENLRDLEAIYSGMPLTYRESFSGIFPTLSDPLLENPKRLSFEPNETFEAVLKRRDDLLSARYKMLFPETVERTIVLTNAALRDKLGMSKEDYIREHVIKSHSLVIQKPPYRPLLPDDTEYLLIWVNKKRGVSYSHTDQAVLKLLSIVFYRLRITANDIVLKRNPDTTKTIHSEDYDHIHAYLRKSKSPL